MGQSFGDPAKCYQATKEDEVTVKKILIVATAALAAFFIALPAAAQTNNEVYEQHACGSVQNSLKALRQFFFSRWQARSAELHDLARDTYIKHHGIEDEGVTHVFIFQSMYFKKLAIVSVKQVGPEKVMCIVKVDGRYHKEYTPDEIHAILSQEQPI